MSDCTLFHIQPSGFVFVSGIASAYDENFYDSRLQGVIPQSDLKKVVSDLNDGLESFWPCMPCYTFGYACMICTVGLSLWCPSICISEAEGAANRILNDYNNQPIYYDRNITFKVKKSCCSSTIDLSVPNAVLANPGAYFEVDIDAPTTSPIPHDDSKEGK